MRSRKTGFFFENMTSESFHAAMLYGPIKVLMGTLAFCTAVLIFDQAVIVNHMQPDDFILLRGWSDLVLHVLAFGCFALIAGLIIGPLAGGFVSFLFAAGIEVAQSFTATRTPSMEDLAASLAGILAAGLAIWLQRHVALWKRDRRQQRAH